MSRGSGLLGMRNLGRESVRLLGECGLETPDDLRRVGAAMAYRMLCYRFPAQTSALLLYALHGAIDGRHWNSYSKAEKAVLREDAEGELQVGPRPPIRSA